MFDKKMTGYHQWKASRILRVYFLFILPKICMMPLFYKTSKSRFKTYLSDWSSVGVGGVVVGNEKELWIFGQTFNPELFQYTSEKPIEGVPYNL